MVSRLWILQSSTTNTKPRYYSEFEALGMVTTVREGLLSSNDFPRNFGSCKEMQAICLEMQHF
jgi:hypothetical protein